MSVYPKPTAQQGAIFNPDLWIVSDVNGVSVDYLNENYLQFPVAQGFETLNGMTNLQSTTIGKNLIMSGDADVNYIEFPDGTQQFTAGGGSGTGDALLAGGTSSSNPQNFTGYNEFSNADGQITLTNTTGPYSVNLQSDSTSSGQLNVVGSIAIGGNCSIGNVNNSNIVVLSADGNTTNQLNIQDSSIQVAGAGYPILLAGYGNSTTNVYGLQVSGGGVLVGNNSGSYTSSYYVQIACSDASDGILNINGSLNVTGTYITLDAATFTYSSSGVSLNSDFECDDINMGTQLTLTNTISSTPTSSTITQSSTDVETLVIDGNIQLSGGTNRSIRLNYTAQPDITLEQNYTGNLLVSAPLEISPNLITYPGNTNTVSISADPTTDDQLDILGSLKTSGQLIITGTGNGITFPDSSVQTTAYTGQVPSGTASLSGGTSSSSPQTFTGYNQINLLQYNGMSCPLKEVSGFVQYQTGNGSQWLWTTNIPSTLGNGFSFAFSTNNTATPYAATTNDVLVPQANGIISGTGYALYQPYTYLGTTYPAYIWSITGYSGTASLTAKTVVNNQGSGAAYYIIQTDDTNSYYATSNIKMTLYIYPQAIV